MTQEPSTVSAPASRAARGRGWRRVLPVCPNRGQKKKSSSRKPPALEYPHEHVSHQDREHQHPQPDGRRVSQVEEAERRLIQPYRDDLGGVTWSSVGRYGDDVEVADGVHRTDEQSHDHDACYGGSHDVAQSLQVVGPVDFGRFDHILVHRGEPRQYDQDYQGRPLPDVHQDHGWQSGACSPQDVSFEDTEFAQHVGVQAVRRVREEASEEPHDDRRHEHRQEDEREHQVLAPDELVHEQGYGYAQDHLQPDGGHEVQRGPRPGRADDLVREHAGPVGEAGEVEGDTVYERDDVQAHPDNVKEWEQREDREQREHRDEHLRLQRDPTPAVGTLRGAGTVSLCGGHYATPDGLEARFLTLACASSKYRLAVFIACSGVFWPASILETSV